MGILGWMAFETPLTISQTPNTNSNAPVGGVGALLLLGGLWMALGGEGTARPATDPVSEPRQRVSA